MRNIEGVVDIGNILNNDGSELIFENLSNITDEDKYYILKNYFRPDLSSYCFSKNVYSWMQ